MKKGIMPTDTDEIKSHILLRKGNCHIPERFYEYALFNIHRDMSKVEAFKKDGFLECNLERIAYKYEGVSYDLLRN